MVVLDFKRARKFTSIQAGCGKYIFRVFATENKIDIAVFDYFSPNPLNRLLVRRVNNSLVVDIGGGMSVWFSRLAFIRCMQGMFDDCPAEDIRTIFDTVFEA